VSAVAMAPRNDGSPNVECRVKAKILRAEK
jgi:hypothetical protein